MTLTDEVLKTKLGTEIPLTTRGILYLCEYNYGKPELIIHDERLYDSSYEALEAYTNIPNPESQLVTGNTFNELITDLIRLHKDVGNEKWLIELAEYL
tara:strand:- start:2280 stop:2573 length:294 start_codon:yes stop_codon:yes gene_type:complete